MKHEVLEQIQRNLSIALGSDGTSKISIIYDYPDRCTNSICRYLIAIYKYNHIHVYDCHSLIELDKFISNTLTEYKPYYPTTYKLYKLTNLDIHEKYRKFRYIITQSDVNAAFVFNLIKQCNNPAIDTLRKAISIFRIFVSNNKIEGMSTYASLSILINAYELSRLPEVNTLFHDVNDGLKLLAKDTVFTILRECITNPKSE